jgi:hypothetical protein
MNQESVRVKTFLDAILLISYHNYERALDLAATHRAALVQPINIAFFASVKLRASKLPSRASNHEGVF